MIIVEQGLVTINIPRNEINNGNITTIATQKWVEKNYYNKEEVDELIENVEVDLTGYATEQWVENKGYLTSIPDEYITETELATELGEYATKSEIPTIPTNVSAFINDSGYATETYVSNNYQVKGNYLTSVPDEYVTETELDNKGYLTSIPDEYITETELATNLEGYATTTYVDEQIGDINTILVNIIG